MKAKLNKLDNGWVLLVDNVMYATDNDKLSLKNCQAIERGYDSVNELAQDHWDRNNMHFVEGLNPYAHKYGYIAGFQKALELMGNKKFTLEDMMNCWNKGLTFQTHKETIGEHIQSLQQTEWDVIVEMDAIPADRAPGGWDRFPKLDADGCLILKLKSE